MSWDAILEKAIILGEKRKEDELSRRKREERIKAIIEQRDEWLNTISKARLSTKGKTKVKAEVFTVPLEAFDDGLRK